MGFKNENRFIFASLYLVREVAQPGSALGWGSRGRKFESCLPDKSKSKPLRLRFTFPLFHSIKYSRVAILLQFLAATFESLFS